MDRVREFAVRFSHVITFLISFLLSGLYFSMTAGSSGYADERESPVLQPAAVPSQPTIIFLPDDTGTPCFTVSCIGAPDPAY